VEHSVKKIALRKEKVKDSVCTREINVSFLKKFFWMAVMIQEMAMPEVIVLLLPSQVWKMKGFTTYLYV